MKKFVLILVAALAVATLGSCNIFGIGSGITLHNNTSGSIWYVYIASPSDTYWGTDELGSDTISAGSSYNFAVVESSVHIRAESLLYYWQLFDVPTAGPLYTNVYVTDSTIYRETEDGLIDQLPSKTGAKAPSTATSKSLDQEGGAIAK